MRISERTKGLLKVSGYIALATGVVCIPCFAETPLEVQAGKVSDFLFGPIAKTGLGAAILAGGGAAAYKGQIGAGAAVVGVGALIGIGIALAKSGSIFNVFS